MVSGSTNYCVESLGFVSCRAHEITTMIDDATSCFCQASSRSADLNMTNATSKYRTPSTESRVVKHFQSGRSVLAEAEVEVAAVVGDKVLRRSFSLMNLPDPSLDDARLLTY